MDRPGAESTGSGERAVTPAVGAVLMIVGTIALAIVVAPFIFSVAQDSGESAPDVDVAFAYSEEVEGSTEDSFGNTAGDVNGDGLLTITLEGGSALDAAQVRVDARGSGGALTAGPYSDGDRVRVGDELTLWITRGESVDLLWESGAGDESDILDQFSMVAVTDLPPGVPTPDYDCGGWSYPSDFNAVDGIDADSNDLILNGVILECDLSQYSNIPNVKIQSGGGLIGSAELTDDSNFKVLSDSGVWGEFVRTFTGGNVKLDTGGEINADVDTSGGGNVVLDGGTAITGSVDASGNVRMDSETTVEGSVEAEGNLNIQGHSTIAGDVTISAGNNIDANSATMNSDVTLTNGATIENLDNTYVGGNVHATDGDSVKLDNGSTVAGDIFVETGDDLECEDGNSSTVGGEGCSAYTEPEFVVSIDDTNSPVEEDNSLRVNATVKNVGVDDDSQTIALQIDGTEVDSTSVTLGGDEATTKTLEWSTNSGDAGSYTATVSSDDSVATQGVEVKTDVADPPTVDQFDTTERPGNGNIGIDVNWEVGAGDADLDTVLVEIVEPTTGAVVDSQSHPVSGTSASNGTRFEGLADGKEYDVTLTVTDVDGVTATETKQQQAG